MAAHKFWRLTFPNIGNDYVTIREARFLAADGSTDLTDGGSGQAIASTIYSPGWEAGKAFNGNLADDWSTVAGAKEGWIAYGKAYPYEPGFFEWYSSNQPTQLNGAPTCSWSENGASWSSESPTLSVVSGSLTATNAWVRVKMEGPWAIDPAPTPVRVMDTTFRRYLTGISTPDLSVRQFAISRNGDFFFGGPGKVYGYVEKSNTPGSPTPLRRKVVLHRMIDNLPVRMTWSRASDGYYEFPSVSIVEKYYTVAFDHTFDKRMAGADNLAAEVMP